MADHPLTEASNAAQPAAPGRFLAERGSTLGLKASAVVLAAYVVLLPSLRWLPWAGVAGRVVVLGALAGVVTVLASRFTDVPLMSTERVRGWLGWSFALGFIPLTALVADTSVHALVETVFDVGPAGTYNDLPASASTGDRWLMWLLAAVCAVVFEELLYRGALLSVALDVTRRPWVAILVASVPWGLSHGGTIGGYNAAEAGGIVAAGAVAAWACYLTRSLIPGVAAHALHNLIASAHLVKPWTLIAAYAAAAASVVLLFVFMLLIWSEHRRQRATSTAD